MSSSCTPDLQNAEQQPTVAEVREVHRKRGEARLRREAETYLSFAASRWYRASKDPAYARLFPASRPDRPGVILVPNIGQSDDDVISGRIARWH